jgi:hypothetical protein
MMCCPVLSVQVGIIRGAPLLENGVGTANTSLVFHAGRLLALHEGDLPYQVCCCVPLQVMWHPCIH